MKPQYIFTAVFAVCIFMGLLLPNMARPVSALPAAADPASAAASPAAEANSPAVIAAEAVPSIPTQQPTFPPPPPTEAPTAQPALANLATRPETAPVFNPPPEGQPTPTPLTSLQQVIPLTAESLPELDSFASSLINNNPQAVTGVYVPGLFALPVVSQPGGDEAYVASQDQTLTQYATPARYGTTGLLAHNYLSGKTFFRLKQGQHIVVIYGDGRKDYYQVSDMHSYQAISPHDPRSDFVDLSDPTYQLQTYTQVFDRVYTTAGQLVFQTCIEANGELSWGRLFVIASPVDPPPGFTN